MSDKQNESERLLSELESLNNTLDNDPFDLDSEQQLEDLPVLKSFVEDVPVLSERIIKEDEEKQDPATATKGAHTADYQGSNHSENSTDPLAISDFVKQQRAANLASSGNTQTTTTPHNSEPSLTSTLPTPVPKAVIEPRTTSDPNITKPTALESNPFLPQSAKDRIRDNRSATTGNNLSSNRPSNNNSNRVSDSSDASSELHALLRQSAKATFDDGQGSPEYQRLRQKASSVINDIVKIQLPRLEAELRMRLEAEVDAMIREQNKE
ncbi:hypothetical protein A9Q81_08930 [Gammaproteobacteria bacterium 42_54_T18]|nr:hypothetical protein A9Q81_08930 [Gammaproteobacteria bacterium 42_54_T18]